jgi:2-(1,2-epoxy-1,2-dihydrophenyl)acetyl-CoA isomerase
MTESSPPPELTYLVQDGIATITLCRPDVGNALSLSLARAFAAALERLATDESVRVVVIASSGRHFCVGGDLREIATAPDRAAFAADLLGALHAGLLRLRATNLPVVAAVQGAVAGGGLGFVLAADVVVASTAATFTGAYATIGISPDCGVAALAPAVVGPKRATALLFGEQAVDAATAASWGLVTQVCPPEELSAQVASWVRRFASLPTAAVRETNRLLRASVGRTYAEALADEVEAVRNLIGPSDALTEVAKRFIR